MRAEFGPECLSCRHDLEDAAVDRSIIFKWISKEEVKNQGLDSCGRGQRPVTPSGKYGNYYIIILNTAGSFSKSW